ncbi:hypothetical protein ACFLRF_02365 [Candidatus Altiarchaeota archaeon]
MMMPVLLAIACGIMYGRLVKFGKSTSLLLLLGAGASFMIGSLPYYDGLYGNAPITFSLTLFSSIIGVAVGAKTRKSS